MDDTPPFDMTATVQVDMRELTATRALSLIHVAEEVIGDMHHKVDAVEAACSAARARIAQRHQRDG